MLGSTESDDSPQPLGLADHVDDLIVRLENWRYRSAVTAALVVTVGVLVGVGWWGRASQPASIDDQIAHIEAVGSPQQADPATTAQPATPGQSDGALASAIEEPVDESVGESVGNSVEGSVEMAGEGAVEVIVVHVSGQVEEPGLVTLEVGARVADAIEAAGGPLDDADIHRLNLAARLADGTQVVVPTIGEDHVEPLIRTPNGSGPGEGASGSIASGPVNLNTADRAELESLPGIGPATASAIQQWRSDNGGFLTVDELLDVPGIGPAKLAALEGLVEV